MQTTQLAIDGGAPVRSCLLPYGRQCVDNDDVQSVVEALRSGWLTTGPKVAEFEEVFAAAVGARFAVAVSSGTAALHAAVFAAGVGSGDEVVTTPMTFAASANCVLYQSGTVKFADVQPGSLNLDVEQVRRQITPKSRAVVVVDFAGQPADLDQFEALADAHRLTLIEDAAHALGATYRGRKVGAIAALTTFSLHPVKHITTGEGGMVTTSDPGLAGRLRSFRNHGIGEDFRQREWLGTWYYEMVDLGYNYRLTDLQCALGLSQLRKLDQWVARRLAIVSRYVEGLADVAELELPATLPDRGPSWHLFAIKLNLDRLRVSREQIFRALRAENIGVNVHYIPVPWHPYYQRLGYMKGEWPVAESAYERLISLPLWAGMADEDVRDVIEAVRKVIDAYRK